VRKDLSVGFVVGKSGGKKITVAAGRKNTHRGEVGLVKSSLTYQT